MLGCRGLAGSHAGDEKERTDSVDAVPLLVSEPRRIQHAVDLGRAVEALPTGRSSEEDPLQGSDEMVGKEKPPAGNERPGCLVEPSDAWSAQWWKEMVESIRSK